MENCHRLFSEHCDPYRHFISPLSYYHSLPLPEPEIHTLTDNTHFHCLLLLDTSGIREKDIEKRGVDSRSHHTFCGGLVYRKYILTPLISPRTDLFAYMSPLPDFKTIADFRKDNIALVKSLLKRVQHLPEGGGSFQVSQHRHRWHEDKSTQFRGPLLLKGEAEENDGRY